MPGQAFITVPSGSGAQTLATAPQVGGVGSANKIPSLDGAGRLDASMMPVGTDFELDAIPASEALAAGAFVNIWNNAGVANVRNADGSADKPADGFVLAAVASGATASVYEEGVNNQVSGQSPGAEVFLSDTTPGQASAAVPTVSGHIIQSLGKALSATAIRVKARARVLIA